MVNKKLIAGILTILVMLATVQSINPVLANDSSEPPGFHAIYLSVSSGQGIVCWSGASTGCTQSMTIVHLLERDTLTITAKGVNGYNFAYWDAISSPDKVTVNPYLISVTNKVTTNPYTISIVNDRYILANFNPA